MYKIITIILIIATVLCISTAAFAANFGKTDSPPVTYNEDISEILAGGPYPEPENAAIPEGVLWNAELGEYYRADTVTWNTVTKSYELITRDVSPDGVNEITAAVYDAKTEYIAKALAEYDRLYEAFWAEDPMRSASSAILVCEEAYAVLASLGKDAVPDIITYIKANPTRAYALMTALEDITGISPDVEKHEDYADEWISEYVSELSQSEDMRELYLRISAEE